MNKLYGFERIGDLQWKETGCWHPTNVISIYRIVNELKKKYLNFNYDIKKVSLHELTPEGVIYKEDENGTDISLFITFENEADEAEFIFGESK